MADKFMDGIGRELRYMEYKLRKKNKGKKGKHQQSGFGLDSSGSSGLSMEAKNALPSNHSEEALQLQIALAMSKEEADQNSKSDMNDKLKLEMALKESTKLAETTKTTQPTAPTNDPWGDKKESVTFEPFSFDQTPKTTQNNGFESQQWPSSSTTNNVQTTSSVLSPPPKSPSKSFDPWGDNSNTYATVSKPKVDAWGTTVAAESKPDPWGATPAVPPPPQQQQQQFGSVDLFNTPNAPVADPWGQTPNGNSQNQATANPFLNASLTPTDQPSFDPLQEFDNLHIAQPQTSTALTAVDIMKMGLHQPSLNEPNLLPVSVDENENNVNTSSSAIPASSFLGENASLVNIDNLVSKKKPANPYLMPMNTGATLEGNGSSRNPFNQKGPSISLNQMKGQSGPQVVQQPTTTPVYGNMQMGMPPQSIGIQQPQMGMMPQGYPNMMPGSYPVGMPTGTVMAPYAPVQNQPFAQQPNQSLF